MKSTSCHHQGFACHVWVFSARALNQTFVGRVHYSPNSNLAECFGTHSARNGSFVPNAKTVKFAYQHFAPPCKLDIFQLAQAMHFSMHDLVLIRHLQHWQIFIAKWLHFGSSNAESNWKNTWQ